MNGSMSTPTKLGIEMTNGDGRTFHSDQAGNIEFMTSPTAAVLGLITVSY